MNHHARYNIGLGLRHGVIVKEGTERELPTFCRLLEATGRRQGFLPEREAYFRDNVLNVPALQTLQRRITLDDLRGPAPPARPATENHALAGSPVVVRHGVTLPLLDLGAALGVGGNREAKAAVVVRHGDRASGSATSDRLVPAIRRASSVRLRAPGDLPSNTTGCPYCTASGIC